jgi:hypothetical protein
MFRQRLLPAALFILPAAAVLTTEATLVEAASEECMAKPGSSASTSSRWYYRVDRVNHRRCWFLSTRDLSAHSRMRRASSLRGRHLISRSTGETDIAQQSEPDEQILAGPTPRQEPMLPDEQTLRELAAPQFDVLTSQGLVPHKVTTISYARPHSGAPTAGGQHVDAMRAGEQSVARGVTVDLVFLGGALATALLVAGGAFQVIGRIQRTRRARQHYPTPGQPDAGAERQKISIRAAQYRPLPSGSTRRQGTGNAPLRRAQ